jgi:hypothetical protein
MWRIFLSVIILKNHRRRKIMVRKRFLKAAAVLLLSVCCAVGAFAQSDEEGRKSASSGGSGAITISGGFALSNMDVSVSGGGLAVEGEVGVGGNVYLDYLLPVGKPISLGLEVGVDSASFKTKDTTFEDKMVAVPVLVRGAWHFDLMPKLDLYAVGKIGYAFGTWTGDLRDYVDKQNADVDNVAGFAWGIDLGVAYYFASAFGVFAEVGFDDYMLETKASTQSVSYNVKAPFNRFVTAGVSVKF